MAGIFGFFDFTKPGPGVEKDEPQKARILVFLDIYSRKFWHLIKLNLLYFLFSVPMLLVYVFLALNILPQFISNNIDMDVFIKLIIGVSMFSVSVITFGPAQAGFTYVLRNYAREEHAFIWSDFKEHAIGNFRQGLIVSLIDLFVVVFVLFDLRLYSSLYKNYTVMIVPIVILLLIFVLFVLMHIYIYQMMITFKLKIKDIYKNAFLFAILKFIPNICILLLCIAIVFITFLEFSIGTMLLACITLSTTGFIMNFYAYPVIKKYMIDKVEEQKEEKRKSRYLAVFIFLLLGIVTNILIDPYLILYSSLIAAIALSTSFSQIKYEISTSEVVTSFTSIP